MAFGIRPLDGRLMPGGLGGEFAFLAGCKSGSFLAVGSVAIERLVFPLGLLCAAGVVLGYCLALSNLSLCTYLDIRPLDGRPTRSPFHGVSKGGFSPFGWSLPTFCQCRK